MDIRIPIAIVALIEIIAPRRLNRAFLGVFTPDAQDVELRWWVTPLTRLEGLVLLGWVVWQTRDELDGYAPREFDAEFEEVTTDEPSVADDRPTLTPGTRRHDIASVLYHAEDPQAASDLVDLSAETDWEMGRSTASATLYRMYNDGLVDREERSDDGSYVYWLMPAAESILEEGDDPIAPNPFPA